MRDRAGENCDPDRERGTPERLQRKLGNRAVGHLAASDDHLSANLRVSEPGTPAERQADRVAKDVGGPATASTDDKAAAGSRTADIGSEEGTTLTGGFASRVDDVRGVGEPLPNEHRRYFESRFDRDFSDVRIRTDRKASGLAAELDARAFTLGDTIAFGHGEFEPETRDGQQLLAHELAHVVQQGGSAKTVQRQATEAATEAIGTATHEAEEQAGLSAYHRSSGYGVATLATILAVLNESTVGPASENVREDVLLFQRVIGAIEGARSVIDWLSEESIAFPADLPRLVDGVLSERETVLEEYEPSEEIDPMDVPNTMAAVQTIRVIHGLGQLGMDEEERQEGTVDLIGIDRDASGDESEFVDGAGALFDMYPSLVQEYLSRNDISRAERMETVGKILAAVGRMRYLFGAIYTGGTKQSDEWEETDQQGTLVELFAREGDAWCTWFATTLHSDVLGQDLGHSSGLRLGGGHAPPSSLKAEYGSERGGEFVGHGWPEHYDEGQSDSMWAFRDLRRALTNSDDEEKEVQDFYEEHFEPQPGDILVLTRGGADAHQFGDESESHTALVESVDGTELHTIEGNIGNRVAGRTYDLADPDVVRDLIYIARVGVPEDIEFPEQASGSDENGAESVGGGVITREQLLAPIRTMNHYLERYAAAMKYIQDGGEPGSTPVSGLSEEAQ